MSLVINIVLIIKFQLVVKCLIIGMGSYWLINHWYYFYELLVSSFEIDLQINLLKFNLVM